MSNVRHRQPVWRWSVVLLSTALLLSPAAARTLLCALAAQQAAIAQANTAAASSSARADHTLPAGNTGNRRHDTSCPADPVRESPRRSEEEDKDALLAASETAEGDEQNDSFFDLAPLLLDHSRLTTVTSVRRGSTDSAAVSAVAFMVSAQDVVLVPDVTPLLRCAVIPRGTEAHPRRAFIRAIPPRAPPLLSA